MKTFTEKEVQQLLKDQKIETTLLLADALEQSFANGMPHKVALATLRLASQAASRTTNQEDARIEAIRILREM